LKSSKDLAPTIASHLKCGSFGQFLETNTSQHYVSYLSFEFQVDIYETLLKFQQYKKIIMLQFSFPQYLKFDEPSIQQ
jgi:hypothetical protein